MIETQEKCAVTELLRTALGGEPPAYASDYLRRVVAFITTCDQTAAAFCSKTNVGDKLKVVGINADKQSMMLGYDVTDADRMDGEPLAACTMRILNELRNHQRRYDSRMQTIRISIAVSKNGELYSIA